jgi:hypothetical protein
LPLPIGRDGRIEGVDYYPVPETPEDDLQVARHRERWPQVISNPADWEPPAGYPHYGQPSTTDWMKEREAEQREREAKKKRGKAAAKRRGTSRTAGAAGSAKKQKKVVE